MAVVRALANGMRRRIMPGKSPNEPCMIIPLDHVAPSIEAAMTRVVEE